MDVMAKMVEMDDGKMEKIVIHLQNKLNVMKPI
jgi:hypothetical protein